MASRKEQKEALRQERLEREQQAAAAEGRRRLIGYGVGGAIALAAVVAIVVVITAGGGDGGGGGGGKFGDGTVPARKVTDLKAAAKTARCQLHDYKDEGRGHTGKTVDYKTKPPNSGPHNPVPAQDQAYYSDEPALENLVHALEHGRIIIWFKRSAPSSVKNDLYALYKEDPPGMLLAPDESGMPYEVAASAWTHVLGCNTMNDRVFDALRAFKDSYRGRGPEPVPF
jgi:uncharacterized protein DUF3105